MRSIPNRLAHPLLPDERLAEGFAGTPDRLMDLAAATGNRSLYSLAWNLLPRKPRKGKTRSDNNAA